MENQKNMKAAVLGAATLALLTLLASPAHAELIAVASIYDSTHGQITRYGPQSATVTSTAAQLPGIGATASSSYGVIKATTSGVVSSGSASGGAGARFADSLLLSNAALNGTQGVVTLAYYFNYDQSVTTSGSGFANGSLSFQAWAGSNYSWYLDYSNSDTGGYKMYEYRDPTGYGRTTGVPTMNYLYVTTGFTWGQFINTSFEINTSVGAYVPSNVAGTAAFDFDAGHSGYWAGIVSASANGQQVTDYALSSRSGTDYSHSFAPATDVPEPGTVPALLFGLAILGMQRLRKRQSV